LGDGGTNERGIVDRLDVQGFADSITGAAFAIGEDAIPVVITGNESFIAPVLE
jgi:hypothetical protein